MGKVTVGGHWLVEEKIGEGSFGEVFRAVHIKTNEQYAIKRELIDEEHPQLPQEAEFLRRLAGPSFIPKLYWFGQEQLYNALVMDLLGPNIRLVRQAYGKLPVPFVSKIAVQMVDILEHVHSRGIVYRDVKPDNFLLERDFAISIKELEKWNSEKDSPKLIDDKHPLLYSPHKISLVDFGLSTFYIDQRTGRHVPKKHPPTKYKTGTARYAAMGVHRGLPHARRDDLESLGYVILELLQGTLPWAGVTARNAVEGWSKMLKMKESKPLEELFEGVPSGFMKFLQYARSLDFDQKPDYAFARNLLVATCRNGYDSELVTLEFEDYSLARPMSPAPLTPANELSFWSDNAFRDFDGGYHSDEWINHNDDSAVKAVVSAWGDGNVKVPWLEDSYPTRNCHPRYNDEPYNQDVIRTRSLNTKQSREWRDLQSRRPSIPSPLSISIPPTRNSAMNTSRGVTSPNYKFEHMQHYSGVDENIPLGPRRSIPNIRNTNTLATKFLKRSVPNLREQAHYNTVPQPSSTIKRTMAHMQDTQPTATTIQGRKGTLNNNSSSPPRCYSFKDNTHNSASQPREEISNTTNGSSPQNVRFSPQDARFSLQDGRYSPQDARFSGRENFRGRERASTFSQFSNVQKQDSRYPPISTSPVTPSRQGSKSYKERERSHTFTSGHNPPVSPSIQNNSPNGPNSFQSNANNWSNGKRERSNTFTNGGKSKDYNYGAKNGCYERRNYMNGPPQNHSQQNSGYNRSGASSNVQKSQTNNRQNQQEEENYPPRSTSTTPTYGHRRSNSHEKVEQRRLSSEINNVPKVTATNEPFFDSIDQKVSNDKIIPRGSNSLDKDMQTPNGTRIEDDKIALNDTAVNKPNHQQNHHVTFSTDLEDNYSYYPNRPSNGYRRQSFSTVNEDKSSRTRSLTFPEIRQNIKIQNDSNGFWKSTTVNGKNPRPVLKNNNQSVTPKLPNGNVHFQDSDGKKKKKKSKWTYYKVNL